MNFTPEAERDFGAFGIEFANDPETGQVVVNLEKADEFDERIGQDVEGLLWLGRLTSDVEIFGHSFTLRTLTRGERLACALFVHDYEDTLGLADALQTAYLSLAIELVDGRPLSIPLEQRESTEARLSRNFAIVQRWYDPVLEALFAEYNLLIVREAEAFRELEGKSPASRATSKP